MIKNTTPAMNTVQDATTQQSLLRSLSQRKSICNLLPPPTTTAIAAPTGAGVTDAGIPSKAEKMLKEKDVEVIIAK